MTHTTENLRYWLALNHVPNLGPIKIQSLLEYFESPQAIFQAGTMAWQAAGLTEKTIHSLSAPDWEKVDSDLRWAEQKHAAILTIDDPEYPQMLKSISDAPTLLYVLGQKAALQQPQLAMVGSRNPSHAGLDIAHEFAACFARMGLTVTSGLALGIDAASHRGALSESAAMGSGYTVAVAGTGLDRVYPARHRELAHEIVEKGVLISEYAPGTPPLPANFSRRNRIISGLSMGVLVVEAALQSGSLITARCASEQGREVFAVPGSIHQPLAKGCHALIRQGAKLVETAEHVLEELAGFIGLMAQNQQDFAIGAADSGLDSGQNKAENEPNSGINVDEEYRQVLKCIDFEPTSVDKVVERSGLTADAVCSMLLVLELQGYVTALSGGYYCQSR